MRSKRPILIGSSLLGALLIIVVLLTHHTWKKQLSPSTTDLHRIALAATRKAGLNPSDWTVSTEIEEVRDSYWVRFSYKHLIPGGYGYVIIDKQSLTAKVRMGE